MTILRSARFRDLWLAWSNNLKNLFSKLFGGGAKSEGSSEVEGESTEYKGFTITPAPQKAGSQYRTAGRISRTSEADGSEPAVSQFIRADNHSTLEQATQHAISKGKQIIDERGDSVFDSGHC